MGLSSAHIYVNFCTLGESNQDLLVAKSALTTALRRINLELIMWRWGLFGRNYLTFKPGYKAYVLQWHGRREADLLEEWLRNNGNMAVAAGRYGYRREAGWCLVKRILTNLLALGYIVAGSGGDTEDYGDIDCTYDNGERAHDDSGGSAGLASLCAEQNLA